MNKEQILSFIQTQIQEGKIQESDIASLIHSQTPSATSSVVQPDTVEPKTKSSNSVTHAFYAIGTVIVLIGVIILIAQNWVEIGFAGRMAVTLGLGLITYISGLIMRGGEHRVISQIMLTLSVVLIPMGVLVFLDETRTELTLNLQISMACAFAFLYAIAYCVTRRVILMLFITGFLSWAYYAALFKVFDFSVFDADLIKWATLLIGVAYVFVGYGIRIGSAESSDMHETHERNTISGLLYILGTAAILGVGITFEGILELFYVLLLFVSFYISVAIRSRSILILSSGFLVGYIMKLTAKYFADSLSWPIALIGSGFLVIAVGYGTYYINKTYINKTQN